MKIATDVEFNKENFTFNVKETKEFDCFKTTRGFQKILNEEFNGCITVEEIKFKITSKNTSDELAVSVNLSKADLQDI